MDENLKNEILATSVAWVILFVPFFIAICWHLKKLNKNKIDVCKCPICENDNIFTVEITHYKCRKCKNTFTN